MADFSTLKAYIASYVKQNGVGAITGEILQDVLLEMVEAIGDEALNSLASALGDEITNRQNAVAGEAETRGNADTAMQNAINAINTKLSEGYVYAGIATTATNPGTPTGKVFYFALAAGTYTNFVDSGASSIILTQGISILKYNGTAWSSEQLTAIDNAPTDGSSALVKSGGVFTAIAAVLNKVADGYLYRGIATTSTNPPTPQTKVFYIATAAGTYTNFGGTVLTQGINILKYDGSAWSGEQVIGIDNAPTAGSNNLVKSGGVYNVSRSLAHSIENIEGLTRLQVFDNKLMTSSQMLTNNYFQVWKYEAKPNTVYLYNGRYVLGQDDRLTALFVKSADDASSAIATSGSVVGAVDKVYVDEVFAYNNVAAYIYLNVQKEHSEAFDVSTYGTQNYINESVLSLKSFGLYLVESWMHKYYIASGLKANNGMSVYKFKVKPNTPYRFSNKYSTGVNVSMIYYLDADGNYISGEFPGSSTEETVYTNEPFTTPSLCHYVMLNVESTNFAYTNLQIDDLSEKPTVKALKYIQTSYVTVDNKFYIASGERSNNYFQYRKYPVQPNMLYAFNGLFEVNTTISFCYFIDGNGNTITDGRYAGSSTAKVEADNVLIMTPSNCAYVYLNVLKANSERFSLVAIGNTDDRTIEIQDRLRSTGHCKLGEGVFYVNNLNMPVNSELEGCGKSTIVVLSGDSDGYAVKLNKYCKVSNILFFGQQQALSPTDPSALDTISIGNRHGILFLGNGNNSDNISNQISDCEFMFFSGGAITCDNTGYAANLGLLVSNCHIQYCGAGINIAYWSEFNRFTNVMAHYCTYGAIINGGNNSFVNCDFSANGIGVYFNGQTDKAVRYDGTAITALNTAHGLMSGSTINHSGIATPNSGYAIVGFNTSGGFLFTGIQLHFGKVRLSVMGNVQFNNIRFGNNVLYEANSGYLNTITDATFGQNFTTRICTDAAMETIDTNYLSDGNLQRVKIINSYNPQGDPVSIQTFTPSN